MMLKTPLDSIDWCAWFGGGWVGCMMWKVWKLYQGHSDFAPSTNLPVLTASAVLLLPVLLSACVLQEVLFRAAAWTALTRAGYWLPARMLGPKYQIPHLQVAPNLPSGVTKKVHNMPTSKSITILSDNHWKLDPRYDIAFQMPRGRRGSVCCRAVIPCHQRVPHRWNSSWSVDIPHICHGRHRRRPCKFFLAVVNS